MNIDQGKSLDHFKQVTICSYSTNILFFMFIRVFLDGQSQLCLVDKHMQSEEPLNKFEMQTVTPLYLVSVRTYKIFVKEIVEIITMGGIHI